MARNNDRDRGSNSSKRAPKDNGRRMKKKVDIIAAEKIEWIDYKDINLLRKFVSDRGKIRARRVSGLSSQNQREVARAVKTARELALLPYTQRMSSEGRSGGRRDRGERGDRGDRGERSERGERNEAAESSATENVIAPEIEGVTVGGEE